MYLDEVVGKTITTITPIGYSDEEVSDRIPEHNETGLFFTAEIGFSDGTSISLSTCSCCGLYFTSGEST